MKNKKMKTSNIGLMFLGAVFIVIFSISAFKVFTIAGKLKKEEDEFYELSAYMQSNELDKNIHDNIMPDKIMDISKLYLINQDIAGWIRIDDTKIDYPVMFTPNEPEYYLHRSFKKEYSSSGVPFIGYGSSPDSKNIIIYAHNMKNGSMFANLLKYEDKGFWKEHNIINFVNLYEENKYEIIGAFYSKKYGSEERNTFKYYNYPSLNTREEYEDYISKVKAASLYDTNTEAQYGDQLITLSTCSYHTKDGRFVVVAKKI